MAWCRPRAGDEGGTAQQKHTGRLLSSLLRKQEEKRRTDGKSEKQGFFKGRPRENFESQLTAGATHQLGRAFPGKRLGASQISLSRKRNVTGWLVTS